MENSYVKIYGNANLLQQTVLSQVNTLCNLSCIMSTVLLSWGWCCNVSQACAVHLSRQLAKLSWLINNHAMVLDQCVSNVLRLSALFLLRLYSAWLRKCKGGVGSFYCLSACRRASQRVVIKARCGISSPRTAVFVSPHGQTQLDVSSP